VVRWFSDFHTAAPLLDLFAPSRIILWRRGRSLLDNLSFLASNERARQVDHSLLFLRGSAYIDRPAVKLWNSKFELWLVRRILFPDVSTTRVSYRTPLHSNIVYLDTVGCLGSIVIRISGIAL
jgi:hypothetical protein